MDTWKPNRPLMFTLPEQFTIFESLMDYLKSHPNNEIAKKLYDEFDREKL